MSRNQLQEQILGIIRAAPQQQVNVDHVMKTLGARSGDAKPRNALDSLVRQGILVKDQSYRPHRYRLSAAGAAAPTVAPVPAPRPVPQVPKPVPEVTEAVPEVTEADIHPGPTDAMATITPPADALTQLRQKLGTAIDAAAADPKKITAARQETITSMLSEFGPQTGAQLKEVLAISEGEVVAVLREMFRAGVVTRSKPGAPFELVQRSVTQMLGTEDVTATCITCSKEVCRGTPTPELVRQIFAHDSSHDVRVRAGTGIYSRKQLEKADAERTGVKEEEGLPSAEEVSTFRLPDGREYAARRLAKMPDVEALRLLRENHVPVCLAGPPGTGKTALVLAAFDDTITINGDGDMAVSDLVGTWTMSGNAEQPYVWADGPLTTAMKQGRPFFMDDFTLISGKVLSVVYPVMDGRGRIIVREHPIQQDDGSWRPEEVEAQAGFWIVGGHNPGVHGAVLSEALASRFGLHIHVPSDYDLAAKMGISRKAIKLALNLQGKQAAGMVSWVPQLRELMAFDKLSQILGEEAAIANLAGICPEEDRTEVCTEIKSVFGKEIKRLELGSQLA